MAALNLEPNVTVMTIQAGVFVANMFVVKKLMLDPYLKVKKARDAATTGSTDEAMSLVKKAENSRIELHNQIDNARTLSAQEFQKSVEAAVKRQEDIINSAKSSVDAQIAATEQQIAQSLQAEESKIEEAVQRLSKLMTEKALAV